MIAVSWAFWMISSIVLHELGHGIAAVRLGDPTPVHRGHMTWNPVVHMGWMSLIMFALVGIAWGAMPVDPSRLRGRHGETIVVAAGPAVNLALFVITLVLLIAAEALLPSTRFADNLRVFLFVGAALNLTLVLFNLLPVPPLDGSRILAQYWSRFREFISSEQGAVVSVVAFVLLFLWGGSRIFGWAFETTHRLRDVGLSVL